MHLLGVFQLKEYFSVDNVLDGSDVERDVTNADGSNFIFIEGINAGESVTLENLQGIDSSLYFIIWHLIRTHVIDCTIFYFVFCTGKFIIPDITACQNARASGGKPTVFVKLSPLDSTHSNFSGNDVISFPLDKNKIECVEGEIYYTRSIIVCEASHGHCIEKKKQLQSYTN